MENGLMTPLIVACTIFGSYCVIFLCILLNMGVFSWLMIGAYLSPLIRILAKENKIRWKRYIESFEPASHDWRESLNEYIESLKT